MHLVGDPYSRHPWGVLIYRHMSGTLYRIEPDGAGVQERLPGQVGRQLKRHLPQQKPVQAEHPTHAKRVRCLMCSVVGTETGKMCLAGRCCYDVPLARQQPVKQL
jgi:hypothetical protein